MTPEAHCRGVGVLAATDEEIDAISQPRLVRFPVVVVVRRADLERVGVEVVP